MKKIILSSAILLFAAIVMAAPVSQEKTLQFATFFFHEHGGHGDLLLVQNTPFDHLHIYQGADGNGFVIISSDDRVFPILGYSATNHLDISDMGPNTRYWLGEYDNQIKWNIENNQEPDVMVRDAWARLEIMLPAPQQAPARISTFNTDNLLTTTWKQQPYFNKQCPYDTIESTRTLTGCVATAMAQIMRYWEHPLRGVGSHSYTDPNYGIQSANFADTVFDYSLMPNSLSSNSSAAQINAVALLNRRCGIAAEVKYGVNATTATTCGDGTFRYKTAENAYRENFKFMHTLHSVNIDNYTDSAWVALLKNEINNGRPVQYSAGEDYSEGGHSFICCGYDNTGKLYFNWGWGGLNDGYYVVGQLNPGSHFYNDRNKAIIGIVPDTIETAQTTLTLVANPQNAGTLTGAGSYTSYQDTATILATAAPGYLFSHWDDSNIFNTYSFVANGGNVTHTAYFERMQGDTLGYCHEANTKNYGSLSNTTKIWAIRLDSNSIAPRKCLTQVKGVFCETGEYVVHIFQGTNICSSNLIYSDTFDIQGNQLLSWQNVPLRDTLRVNRSLPLWIAMEWTGSGYPAAFSFYRGNPDGSWYANSIDGNWTNCVTDKQQYLSFQIRGVFADRTGLYDITVLSSDSTQGSVTGGGSFPLDSSVVITATSQPGYHFKNWQDGNTDSVRTVVVTDDLVFTAYFEKNTPSAVDNVLAQDIITYVNDHCIIVEKASGLDIRIYDATGKMVTSKTSASDCESFTLATGVYFVRINGNTDKLIIK